MKSKPKPQPRTIGDQLREIIDSRGISQTELAELAGIDRKIIGRWLSGARPTMTLASVEKIATVLGLRLVEVGRPRRSR